MILINRNYFKEAQVYRNIQLYIRKNDFKGLCVEQEVCTVTIKIEMESTKNLTKTLELTMYQIDKTPFYLEKMQ